MKQSTNFTQPDVTERRRRWSAGVLLGFALVISACSSADLASGAQTAPETTVATKSTPVVTETAPPTTAAPPPETKPNIDEVVAEEVDAVDEYLNQLESSGFGGVVAIREGSDITSRAYGIADRENAVPIDTETVFDIGSITKQFTAAAILRLEMDGRLSVDDQLGQHVPGLPEDKAAITLHQLLTHTSGVPNALGPDDQPIGRDHFLALAGVAPLLHEPGDQYLYSNVGYALLAAVIEFETGGSYEAYLRSAVLSPAGMFDTGYVLPNWDGHTIAVGYRHPRGDRFGRPNEQAWDVDGPYWNLHGNGGLLSTAFDMLAWDEALSNDEVLDSIAKEKFFAPHVLDGPDEGVHYGYGWEVIPTPMGTPIITHAGTNHVFFAHFLRFPDQDVTIYMATNSLEDGHGNIAFDVANHVLDGALEVMFGS